MEAQGVFGATRLSRPRLIFWLRPNSEAGEEGWSYCLRAFQSPQHELRLHAVAGRRLLHYEVLEQIGEGGMSVVYKALDTHLDRHVALKALPPEKVADPERKRRFVQEAKAASALKHPNIITIRDIAEDGGVDFIVMEYVEGRTLSAIIGGGLSPERFLRYAVQMAGAQACIRLSPAVLPLRTASLGVIPEIDGSLRFWILTQTGRLGGRQRREDRWSGRRMPPGSRTGRRKVNWAFGTLRLVDWWSG